FRFAQDRLRGGGRSCRFGFLGCHESSLGSFRAGKPFAAGCTRRSPAQSRALNPCSKGTVFSSAPLTDCLGGGYDFVPEVRKSLGVTSNRSLKARRKRERDSTPTAYALSVTLPRHVLT